VLCVISIIGTLWYAVSQTLTLFGSPADSPATDIFVGFLNFALPLLVAYTISANHPSSRILILGYATAVYVWALYTERLSEVLSQGPYISAAIATIAYVFVLIWLFRSPKMRYYFALIKNRPVPADLLEFGDSLAGDSWLSENARNRLNWVADHLETIVLVGFIVVVIIAFSVTGKYS